MSKEKKKTTIRNEKIEQPGQTGYIIDLTAEGLL